MSTPPAYPLVEGFWIRNYKVLKQIAIGSSFQQSVVMDVESDMIPYELTPLSVFTGESETGKSAILDAFDFIADILQTGLDDAVAKRGGFDAIYNNTGTGAIAFGIVFRFSADPTPMTYILNLDRLPKTNKAYIETEAILYRNAEIGQPRPILYFQNGVKHVRLIQPWYSASGTAIAQVKNIDNKTSALGVLSKFEDLPDIPQFKQYLDRYFIANYTSSNACSLSPPQFKFKNVENLASDLKRVKEKHPVEFTDIMSIIAGRMSNIDRVEYKVLESGRTVLLFFSAGSDKPVYPVQVGESTLRLLSLLTLLEDPLPPRMMAIEEPAAAMSKRYVQSFVHALQGYIREMGGTQFFIATHSNVFLDLIDPSEVWILSKDNIGNISASRALDELQFLGVNIDDIRSYWFTDYIYRHNESIGMETGVIRQRGNQ